MVDVEQESKGLQENLKQTRINMFLISRGQDGQLLHSIDIKE
jgi:hypothetical protein